MKQHKLALTIACCIALSQNTHACTGITLKSRTNDVIVARTMDWSGEEMNNLYVIIPRDHEQQSLLPDGTTDGLAFKALYGYAGLAAQQPEFIIDGTNEAGLSAALFYFPNYGKYQPYNENNKGNIQIHSVRMPGFVASQQVIFGADGQILKIHHDTINRECYMSGVKLAIEYLFKNNEFIYGLENII